MDQKSGEARAIWVSVVTILGNVVLTLLKLAAGLVAHSGAMVSDAVHSASDVLSTFVVIAGVKLAGKEADREHPFGHERFECMAAILLASMLAVTGLGIGWTGVGNILGGADALPIPGRVALAAAVLSIVSKEAMYWYTRAAAKKLNSPSLMADAWHHRSDALSSVGSFVGICGARLGIPELDPAASVVICLFILKAAWDIFRDAAAKMLDTACPEEMEEEMRQKYIDIAYTKAKRLEKLIEDLFGFTKMNCGKIAMHVGRVDIVKLLGQLLEEFYPSFADKGLTYELTSNVPSLEITADGNLLARLFDNLINNAIKYGAEGKKVLVKVEAEEEVVSVSVVNFGYVIPEGELHLIFNKFYRVEQSRSTATGGTGLGLAIVKNIVDMHGGTISVTSDLNGTVFQVKLKIDFDVNRENFRAIG